MGRSLRPNQPAPAYLALTAVVAALLLSSLVIDLVPRFHLGDSAVFISTRYGKLIPDNRSWTYGLALGCILRSTAQLASLPLCQIFLSWTAFALFAAAVASTVKLSYHWAIVIFLIGCLEPLGYYWSRSFMADSPAQSMFVLLCAVLLSRTGAVWKFLFVLTIGFALISLRVVYYPALIAALLVTFAYRYYDFRFNEREKAAGTRFFGDFDARAWAAALAALLLANLSYAYMNTSMTRGQVLSTNIGDMEFLVGALSPLMSDELDKTPLTSSERASLVPPAYENRVAHTFAPHGFVELIRGHFQSREKARPTMRRLVFDTIRDHPFQLAQLILRQWFDYLNPVLVVRNQYTGALSGAVSAFPGDSRVILPDYIIQAFAAWGIRPVPDQTFPTKPSLALQYLELAGGMWSLLLSYCATLAIVFLPFVRRSEQKQFLVFASGFSFFYMATLAFGANQLVTRYLLPLDVPLFYSVVLWLSARTKRKQLSQRSAIDWIFPLASHEQNRIEFYFAQITDP